ncbi:MAG: lipid-A-disaccharide synthase [Chlamydiota bacterium]
MTPDLFFLAGEASGDLHGAHLLSALQKLDPNLVIGGIGGPKMRAQGMHCFLPMEAFEVMGFLDIIPALPRLARYFRRVKHHLLTTPPKTIVFIDYPGFNLRLARALQRKKCSAKKIQYVCPSVWAWGKRRIPLMGRTLDHLLALLPFEPEMFHNEPIKVQYIGHPVVQSIANHSYDRNWRNHYGIPKKAPLFAIFPGSREKELKRNFPLQAHIAHKLAQEFPSLCLAISCATPKLEPLIRAYLPPNAHVIPNHHAYELMRDARLAVATSGTVTLELALHQVPTVVTYAITSLDTFLARHLLRIRLPYYALPNLIAQKEIFPELFGPQLTPLSLEQKLREYLISECNRQVCVKACDHLKTRLGKEHASELAAQIILSTMR